MFATSQRRALPRTSLIGDQGRAWLREIANAAALLVILTGAWALLYHLPAAKAFVEALLDEVR